MRSEVCWFKLRKILWRQRNFSLLENIPGADIDLSDLNRRNNWFVNEGMEDGIRFPQYFPIKGEFSVPPFLNKRRAIHLSYLQGWGGILDPLPTVLCECQLHPCRYNFCLKVPALLFLGFYNFYKKN